MTPDELRKNVSTIVVLMMENRSFDNVLGYLRHPQEGNRTDVEGIEDLGNDQYVNKNTDGIARRPFWRSDAPYVSDLPHNSGAVREQLNLIAQFNMYGMNGFVRAYEDQFHSIVDDPPVMGLLRAKDLPTTAPLADQYTVCDHWFACLPTSTAPNRLMSMCGASAIAETGILVPDQPTVYDWLTEHNVRWRVYAAGLPFFALMPKMAPLFLTQHFRRLSDLPADLEKEGPDEWPQVLFIEPDYYDCPVHFHPPCDNHAPLAMAPGEAFVAQAYRWLTGTPRALEKWGQTVFILTYDEHGGLFDHVPPRPVTYRNPNNAVSFDTTGPRTPTIVAGPFAPKKKVFKGVLDNTSILQLIAERFGTPGEIYSPEVLGRAQQGIGSVSAVLDPAANNVAICPVGAAPAGVAPAAAGPAAVVNSELRQAFQGTLSKLISQHPTEIFARYPELRGK